VALEIFPKFRLKFRGELRILFEKFTVEFKVTPIFQFFQFLLTVF